MKKSDFIDKYLLDVCIQKVEDTENNIKEANIELMMSMNIFPYESKENDGYANLISEDKFWYYRTDNNDITEKGNSSNYRILDEKRLSPKHSEKIKNIFRKIIKEYSSQSIIDNLIKEKMAKCNDYDEDWWSCARDIFDLWNGKSQVYFSKKATDSIQSNYFLFDDISYCDNLTKLLIIKYGVYKDITENKFYEKYFYGVDKEKVARLLKFFGVKNKFSKQDDGELDDYVFHLISVFSEKSKYPVSDKNADFELCSLIERIVKIIFENDNKSFIKLLNNDKIKKGIPLKNINNKFVPLSSTLFYNIPNTDYNSSIYSELILNTERYDKNFLNDYAVDAQRDIDTSKFKFDGMPSRYNDSIHKLYCWIWQFNKSHFYALSVINSLSSENEVTINDDITAAFILDILKVVDNDISGVLKLKITVNRNLLWKRYEDINELFIKYLENIPFSICCRMQQHKLDASAKNMKNHILSDVSRDLYQEWFWNNIYIDDDFSQEEGYVILNNAFETEKKILVLRKNTDEKAYIRSIKRFIQQYYKVSVNNIDEGIVDWKRQYDILKDGISRFLNKSKPKHSLSGISFVNIHMNDVMTYDEEKKVWKDVKKAREKIRKSKSIPDFSEVFGTREFLKSVYHGYCQVCHDKMCTSDIKSHFYTYRIVKPKEFKEDEFADMAANLFSVCPTCHGALRYGEFMGFNMENLVDLTRKYVNLYIKNIEKLSDTEDSDDSIVSQFMYEKEPNDDRIPDEISNAIITKVMVNGIERYMFFSWEHFIRLAMILNEDLIYNDN